LALGLGAWLVAPNYPGFFLLPAFLGLALSLVYGPAAIKADLAAWGRPAGRRRLKRAGSCLLALLALTAAGALTSLPIYNPGGAEGLALSPAELKAIERLPAATTLEVFLSAGGEARHGPLLSLYARASAKIAVVKSHGPGRAEAVSKGQAIQLALPDQVVVRSGPYAETVNPFSRQGLAAAVQRLSSPSRIVYNLVGDGEKSTQDLSPLGLAAWSASLEKRKIFLRDFFWAPDAPLPREGDGAILAGPTAALTPEKNSALLNYLAQGGKLMALQDPLAPGLDPEAFSPLGLVLAPGLLVDPETAWAGTNDFFPVSSNFPAHPATVGLTQPVVWPLAGAILKAEGFEETADPEDPLAGHTWAVALSGPESYLETDLAAIAKRRPKLDSQADPAGPLALATATSLAGGGRLALLADSDLAANAFVGNPGNRALMDGLLGWLLGAQDDLAPSSPGESFYVSQNLARAMFWLPAVVWPSLAVLAWALYYRRRRAS
jgi:hypothetical protein